MPQFSDTFTPPPSPGATNSLAEFYASQIESLPPGVMPGGGSSPQQSDALLVYLGMETTKADPSKDSSEAGSASVRGPKQADAMELLQKFEKADKKEQRRMALLLTIAGFTGSTELDNAAEYAADLSLGEVVDAYASLLEVAAGKWATGQKITPDQLLAQAISFRLPGRVDWDGDFNSLVSALSESSTAGFKPPKNATSPTGDPQTDKLAEELKDKLKELNESPAGTYSTTNTSISRDIMDPNDAMALTRGMLQRELGRDPTQAEFEDFIGTLQGAQQANPSATTATRTYTLDDEGRVVADRQVSTTQSGIGASGLADIALRNARSQPSWAEWQAVGTYAPALFQALGSTVPGA